MKNPRFPGLDTIKKNLIYPTGEYMHASLAGALSSYYAIAREEFEHLREMAQEAIEGDLDDRSRLARYLQMTDETAELYAISDRIAEEGKCELEVEATT